MSVPRTEEQIFSDIVNLCTRPGYVHVIACLSFRNNVMQVENNLTSEDVARNWSGDYLIQNEINALISCMVKADIDWTIPSPDQIQEMIDTSHRLLREYHDRLLYNARSIPSAASAVKDFDPMSTGDSLREAIFYAPDSAHDFQFRDMAAERYSNDAAWIRKNLGYDPTDAKEICKAISDSLDEIMNSTFNERKTKSPEKWSILPGFRLDINKITSRSGVTKARVEAFLAAFTWDVAHRNKEHKHLDDFNCVNVKPIILDPDGERYLFQYYRLVEATYDTPFYEMVDDDDYCKPAGRHRGMFTENFLADRLRGVFGDQAVFQNINVYLGKDREGEIDCLVVFGEYGLLFQAKSKRLTVPARKGEIANLTDDFKLAVEHAYEQAVICAKAMNEEGVRFERLDGTMLDLPPVERVYPVCVLADHYPALAIQTRAFLRSKIDSELEPPLVCDLFLIDVLTEILSSPLRVLSYITLRAGYGKGILTESEITTLGYHLKGNLKIDDGFRQVLLDRKLVSELHAAMMVRRNGWPGESTPKGILTRFKDTRLEKIISEIEHDSNEFAVGMGLEILKMDGDSIAELSFEIDELVRDAGRTGRIVELTRRMGQSDAGLTIHVNGQPRTEAEEMLCLHMKCYKYTQRAGKWFGLVIAPTTGQLRFGVKIEEPHASNPEMEAAIAANASAFKRLGNFKSIQDIRKNRAAKKDVGRNVDGKTETGKKVGRNEPCPCGSGKKHKRCCGG